MSAVGSWIKSHLGGLTDQGIANFIVWVAKGLISIKEVWIIIALIGVYIIIFGNRRLGTKFTSVSILTYLIAEVISRC